MTDHRHLSLKVMALQLVLVCVLLVVVASVVTSSSAVCRGCHAMRPYVEAQAAGKHASVSCYTCHLSGGLWSFPGQKVREFLGMYPAALLGRGLTGPSTPVAASTCLGCHRSILENTYRKGQIRIRHASCAPGGSCDGCHGAVPHGSAVRWASAPEMSSCIACHRDANATVSCDECHTGRSAGQRLSKGLWAVTHGPNWRQAHGMGDIRYCDACHPQDYCVRCHGTRLPHPDTFYVSHGGDAQRKSAKCLSCHQRKFCDDCHSVQMPHPAGFRKQHVTVAKNASDPVCLKCHRQEDCRRCHAAHTHPGKTEGTLGGTSLPTAQGKAR